MSAISALTADELAAQQILQIAQQQYQQLVQSGLRGYNLIWKNSQSTPQQIVAALGTDAAQVFELAALNIQTIASAALIAGIDAPTLPSIPTGWTVTPNSDGTVTLTAPQS